MIPTVSNSDIIMRIMQVSKMRHSSGFFFFFLRDFIYKKTLFEKIIMYGLCMVTGTHLSWPSWHHTCQTLLDEGTPLDLRGIRGRCPCLGWCPIICWTPAKGLFINNNNVNWLTCGYNIALFLIYKKKTMFYS